jgi:DNA-binding IclR family transcriptional regulator
VTDGLLDRALRVLAAFHEDAAELSAAQLAERTGIALSSLHRLLGTLVAQGLLMRVPGHRYAIGARLWELGELSPLSLRLRETALPHMMRLYEATGENVHLAVLDGPTPAASHALVVGRVTGRSSIATISRMGSREPLHTTGVGKALLATRDDPWLREYFERPLLPQTTRSLVTEESLRVDLERTRARGFAVTREEMTLGNMSFAAALGRVDGLPPAAIGVVVHLERADARRLAPLVVQAARELRAALELDSH